MDKVKKALVLVEEELRDSDIFLDFFEFAFKFCLTVRLSRTNSLCHNQIISNRSEILFKTPYRSPRIPPYIVFCRDLTLQSFDSMIRCTLQGTLPLDTDTHNFHFECMYTGARTEDH